MDETMRKASESALTLKRLREQDEREELWTMAAKDGLITWLEGKRQADEPGIAPIPPTKEKP